MNMARQEWPDRLKVFAKIDGEMVEVGRRYRDDRGNLQVAWSISLTKVPALLFLDLEQDGSGREKRPRRAASPDRGLPRASILG